MKKNIFIYVVTLLSLCVFPFTTHAANDSLMSAQQVNISGFSDKNNTQAQLLKVPANAFDVDVPFWQSKLLVAFTSNVNGVQLWYADMDGKNWQQITNSELTADTTNTKALSAFSFRGRPYVVLGNNNSFEIWKYAIGKDLEKYGYSTEPEWKKIMESNDDKSLFTAIYRQGRKHLFFATDSDENGAKLYYWDWWDADYHEITTGLEKINAIRLYKKSIYLATEDGKILQADISDAMDVNRDLHKDFEIQNWETVYQQPGQAFYAFAVGGKKSSRKLIAGGQNEQDKALIIKTKNGSLWDVAVEGFEGLKNQKVNRLSVNKKGILLAYIISSDGTQIWKTKAKRKLKKWSLKSTDGILNCNNNTQLTSIIKYRGEVFGSLKNKTNGVQVYTK